FRERGRAELPPIPLNQACPRQYFDSFAGRRLRQQLGDGPSPRRDVQSGKGRAAMAIDSLRLPDLDKMDRLNNRLLAAMPRSATTLLKPFIRQLMLPPGFVCLDAGEPIEQIYFPVSGLISQVVSTSEGEVVETAMVGREGAVGLQSAFGQRLSFTRAMVLVGGTFYAIPAEQLRLALSEEAKALVYRYVETELAEALQLAVCNAVHAGPARLARWLLQSADRTASE